MPLSGCAGDAAGRAGPCCAAGTLGLHELGLAVLLDSSSGANSAGRGTCAGPATCKHFVKVSLRVLAVWV